MQNALVLIIVLLAACYVVRRIYRSFFGKKPPCGCSGTCEGCDIIDKKGDDKKTPDSCAGGDR